MARRRPKTDVDDVDQAATRLRGEDSQGNVRPADNRYLTPEEIAERDAYLEQVEEETGMEPQQLLVKREAPDHVDEISSRDRTDTDDKPRRTRGAK